MKGLPLIFSIFLSASLMGQLPLTQLVKSNEKSVFIIITYDKYGNPLAQGSGFFIDSNGTAITNVHVLENSVKAEIKTLNKKTYTISKIIAYSENYDLAKFTVNNLNREKFTFVRISKDKPQKGEDVFVIGNPMGLESTVTNGIVASVREMEGYGNTIQISAPISPGSSGGPVFNMKGQVIGVATFGITKGQNLNFAVDINRIYDLGEKRNDDLLTASKSINYDEATLKGLDAYHNQDWSMAISYFLQAVEKSKEKRRLYFYLGVAYEALHDYSKAIYFDDLSITIKPTTEAYYNKGVAEDDLGDYSSAMVCYNNALSLDPNYAKAYSNRGGLYDRMNNTSQALMDFNKAIQLDNNISEAYYMRGRLKMKLDDSYGAISDFTQAISINPSDGEAYQLRGETKFFLKDYRSALSDFLTYFQLEPNNTDADAAETYNWAGGCYKNLGNDYQACQMWKRGAYLGSKGARNNAQDCN